MSTGIILVSQLETVLRDLREAQNALKHGDLAEVSGLIAEACVEVCDILDDMEGSS